MHKELGELIVALADAPESHLDEKGAKLCGEWDKTTDPLKFLRNLLDLCVRYAWGSGFVIHIIRENTGQWEESESEAATRRDELLETWEPESI